MRDRLSKSALGDLLTLSEDIGIYDCENFILEGAIERYPFSHWLGHLVPLHVKLSDDYRNRAYKALEEFDLLKNTIAENLQYAGFSEQAKDFEIVESEADLNSIIIKQYTEENGIYPYINNLLRKGHSGNDVSHDPLVPWICQLAVSLRQLDEYTGPSFRGSNMPSSDIEKYKVDSIYIWAPFTSASKSIDSCFGGNVIFELVPVSALSERDKRAPRDVSHISDFPEEEEVLLPMCCAYRPTKIEERSGVTYIRSEILDHY
ncbi:hypothetical protein [Salinimonas lutimaris]|uniref:hypothetical protein n=1 Tax=Salinimonas lutimaris TaxID=914153 RepID=UPI0010BFD703|nr:hypothetical protein [Salinimonas lutimaris]